MTAQPHPRVCSGSVLVLVLVLRRLRGAAAWQTLAVFHLRKRFVAGRVG